jgi:UDP-N-acetylglucosamine--N-acetylmuramyl-(pentapeptide) pyrophosphoryl-undecaprenol N-acetylglucosamine transferase
MPHATHAVQRRTIMLAAGGTGGHLFPAQALAEELVRRNYVIHLMTDERVRDYGRDFPALEIHLVPSATLSLSKPWLLPLRVMRLSKGYRMARDILDRLRPGAVAGFGGYPSFPPIMAAARLKIPCLIHEQNAVMGRANRVLAHFTDAVASSFPTLAKLPERAAKKLVQTGNPVRANVLAQAAAPYHAPGADEPFNLLVFGGSQGARFFAEFAPAAMRALPKAVLKTLRVTQQCRPEDLEAVKAVYREIELEAELQPFFSDMPQRIAASHLVLCRSGASTIAELGVIGRPAVLVPLPHALDNDQLKNAESFTKAGGGWLRRQSEFKPEEFAAFLTRLRYQEQELQLAAKGALSHGKPDAAQRLADLVERLAEMHELKETIES